MHTNTWIHFYSILEKCIYRTSHIYAYSAQFETMTTTHHDVDDKWLAPKVLTIHASHHPAHSHLTFVLLLLLLLLFRMVIITIDSASTYILRISRTWKRMSNLNVVHYFIRAIIFCIHVYNTCWKFYIDEYAHQVHQ